MWEYESYGLHYALQSDHRSTKRCERTVPDSVLSPTSWPRACGLSWNALHDVEAYEDEATTVVDLAKLKRLLDVPGLNVFRLLGRVAPAARQADRHPER